MNFLNLTYSKDMTHWISMLLTIVGFLVFLIVYLIVYKRVKKYVRKKTNHWDDFMVELFKFPLLWFFVWIMINVFTHTFLYNLTIFQYISHFNNILLILSIAWILIKAVKVGTYLVEAKLDIKTADNLKARKSLTQLRVFQSIADAIIIIIAISVILMTFDEAKAIGKSLLTSAGVLGIIVGFAAQKSIGMFLAGIQIAITQPIRLDDVVIVEGEWGKIEEITLTYVVVQIWDSRRLVLPITYFLEKPFQNWTKTKADIIGTVFFYVGFDFPVQALRDFLPEILKDNKNWDGSVWNIQVTNTNERFMELRVMVSSSDASKSWDLRVEIREKVLAFIQAKYPQCFVKIRLQNDNPLPEQSMDTPTMNGKV